MRKPVVLLLILLVLGSSGLYWKYIREELPARAGQQVEILIEPGQRAADVATELVRLGAVSDRARLLRWMSRLGIDRRIRPGFYAIEAGFARDVAQALAAAKPEVLQVQIIPGAVFDEVAAAFKREDAPALLKRALEDGTNFAPELRGLLGASAKERLVFLAPETYAIDPGAGAADELVKVASRKWWQLHGQLVAKDATSADLLADGILASIVQKEALVDAERPVIAGVFKNRLQQEMPLQSCATVVYAWRLRGVKRTALSFEDLKIVSPYNTYERMGLPPGNIGVPAAVSWNAVLKPSETDNLFFVAKPDGSHVFTKTYKEHLAAQKKIRSGGI